MAQKDGAILFVVTPHRPTGSFCVPRDHGFLPEITKEPRIPHDR